MRLRGPLIALLFVILGITGPLWMGGYFLGVFTTAFYFAVFAMAWDLLFGFAGMVNFGPTFLIGLGAYGAGLLNNAGIGIPLALLGGTAAAIVGAVLGGVLAGKVPQAALRKGFGWFVLAMGVLVLAQSVLGA